MTISHIKFQARQTLKDLPGKYQLFLIPIILNYFIAYTGISRQMNSLTDNYFSGVSLVGLVFPIVITFLEELFILSAVYTMVAVIRGCRQSVTMKDITYSFSTPIFIKLILTLILRWIMTNIWFLPLYVLTFIYTLIDNPILAFLVGISAIIALIISINRQFAYVLTPFILMDQVETDTYQGSLKAIQTSRELMKGHKWQYFILELSFIGWYFLVLITFGLASIYLTPYKNTAIATFYQTLTKE